MNWKRLAKRLLGKSKQLEAKYKIGNVKFHNSKIDSVIPQFVEIGDNFISAPGSIITAHDASLFVHTGKYRIEKIKIGNNVFLGANAVILPGVTIGDNVIIGAGAVVTKDVESDCVVAGNPAKVFCSIREYIAKCEDKNCLYKAPESFQKIWKSIRPKREEVEAFQTQIIEDHKKRSKLVN